jgi:hypothetical protein
MIAVKRKPTITELTRIILSSHPGGGGVNPAVALDGFSQQWIGVAIDLAVDPIIHAVFFLSGFIRHCDGTFPVRVLRRLRRGILQHTAQ